MTKGEVIVPENQNLVARTMLNHGAFIKIGGSLILLVLFVFWIGIAVTGFIVFLAWGARMIARVREPIYQGERFEDERDHFLVKGLGLIVLGLVFLWFA